MGCFHRVWSVLSCFFVWSVAILRTADGGNITWYEPPPFETVTDATIPSTTHKNLTKGFINEELSCNFSLTADLSIITVTMIFEGVIVATYVPSTGIIPGGSFASRFSATWVPTKMTLIVFNVTIADEGEYSCSVLTAVGTWARTIQVAVLDSAVGGCSDGGATLPDVLFLGKRRTGCWWRSTIFLRHGKTFAAWK